MIDYHPAFDADGPFPHLILGTTTKFTTALNILRAVRALALGNGDEDLSEYALKLQMAVIQWSKILPKDSEDKQRAVDTDTGPYR